MSADLFSHARVARGYARHRPRFHPQVVERIAAFTGLAQQGPTQQGHALDIGCGTGLSTEALTPLSANQTGVDASPDMVAQATPAEGRHYAAATAECLPFAAGRFDLVAVCGAINWIDRGLFLPEARRVLKERGWLVVYDGAERGAMAGRPEFARWYSDHYLKRYPRPPRDERPVTPEEAARGGLDFVHSEDYTLEWPFDLESYVAFMMTQSNITSAVKRGLVAETVRADLLSSLKPHFSPGRQRLLFGGYIWYLRPQTGNR